jgi:serine/threonine protein kinase
MNKKFNAATTFLGEYSNKKKLGKGAFGDVFLVENKKGELFALKVIDKQKMSGDNEDMIDYLKGEIKCMKEMKY